FVAALFEFLCEKAGVVSLQKCPELNGELAGNAGLDLIVGFIGCGHRWLIFLNCRLIRIDRSFVVVTFYGRSIFLSGRGDRFGFHNWWGRRRHGYKLWRRNLGDKRE